jgi:hypothetical protein
MRIQSLRGRVEKSYGFLPLALTNSCDVVAAEDRLELVDLDQKLELLPEAVHGVNTPWPTPAAACSAGL